MSSEEEAWEKLDSEFDHYVVDMKSYVLKLPHKSERYRCAVWIKKFCEPSGAGTGIVGRKNRNLYAKLLLHMLKRGVLEGPFTQKPESGILKTLPSYMSIYFDEPSSKRAWSNIPEDVRDWVMEELGQSDHKPDESWKLSFKEESALVSTPSKQREQFTCNGKLALRSHSTSPPHLSEDETLPSNTKGDCYRRKTSFDDSDFEARLNSWNLGLENPRYLREKPMSLSLMSPKFGLGKNSTSRDEQALLRIHEKELEMKSKLMEARLHEEKLKLQQRHDADVQKILDRKNNEIDVLKSLYRTKQNEAEETIQKLEKKVQTLVRESQVIREAQEKQILELKKLCEHSTDSLNNEWEKKLHNAVAEMEKDKFNLQKKHTENIQELLEDTNARLSKMEAEYLAETKTTNQMVKELEARVHQLTVEAETSYLQHQKLSQEKNNLEQSYQSASLELEEIKARYNSLQKERGRMMEEHKQNIKQLQSKYEVDLNLMKKEHALSAMKTSDVTEDLKQCVSELKQQLLESDHQRQQQLQEQEQMFLQEKADLERIHDKKIYEIQSDFDKERIESHKKIRKLEDLLREREEHLTQVMEAQRLQAQQADAALEEFKRQVELNSEKVYAEMKEQMEKVEADLNKSKSFREKQSKEFSWQLEELKQKHEQQIVELKLEHEQEKTHLFQEHNTEKDCLVRDHEREIEKLEKQLRAAMTDYDNKTQEYRKRDAQIICDMEAQIHSLREELIQVNTQRKQQLVELSLLREEEKQRAARDHETTMNKVKAESEKMILDLKKTNAAEKEMALEKANGKLKQIEKEYNQKLAKSSQIIAELKTTISSLTEESNQRQLAGERRLQDVLQKFEDEKQQLIRDNDTAIKGLQDEIESYHNQVQSAEEKLQQKDLEAQEQVTSIRQEYETKLKGLMPASLRQELEDTILSLKSQVNFLRKRASILQDELSTYRTRR
ncbi:centrosomal protein of 112 kDa isoform X3 [Ahaetulla prasina]|uniref:centrosomal protein of 112 kDa isoform X2 n=1 Tax=Ahaetulla prasina TaxID=499056 RepID=UPI002649E041|nr:centrosomal protein of 112 kDa isoform X2 [Ahaetulla prasina]XP_058026457.1 centrosomal protein of 112 kDa isoform X3 [Ahaetulla prasina]